MEKAKGQATDTTKNGTSERKNEASASKPERLIKESKA